MHSWWAAPSGALCSLSLSILFPGGSATPYWVEASLLFLVTRWPTSSCLSTISLLPPTPTDLELQLPGDHTHENGHNEFRLRRTIERQHRRHQEGTSGAQQRSATNVTKRTDCSRRQSIGSENGAKRCEAHRWRWPPALGTKCLITPIPPPRKNSNTCVSTKQARGWPGLVGCAAPERRTATPPINPPQKQQ